MRSVVAWLRSRAVNCRVRQNPSAPAFDSISSAPASRAPPPGEYSVTGLSSLEDEGFAASVEFLFDYRGPIIVNVTRTAGEDLEPSLWCGLERSCGEGT